MTLPYRLESIDLLDEAWTEGVYPRSMLLAYNKLVACHTTNLLSVPAKAIVGLKWKPQERSKSPMAWR